MDKQDVEFLVVFFQKTRPDREDVTRAQWAIMIGIMAGMLGKNYPEVSSLDFIAAVHNKFINEEE